MKASDGDRRFTASLRSVRGVVRAGPRWESSRVRTSAAAAAIAVLVVTGVVALSTSGSAAPQAKSVADTSRPATKPHYLLPIAALVQDGSVPAPTLSGDNGTVGVPKGTAARPTKPTTNPDPGNIATYRGAIGTMTPVGIATLALERGCSIAEAPTATAIAMAESGGSPSAQGDISLMTNVWDWSAGLWQIRGLRAQRGTGALRDSIANQQAVTNSVAMYAISSGCTNWSPWTTYTRGLYVGYLSIAQQAVNYVVAYFKAHGGYPAVAAPDPSAVIPVSSGGGAAVPATVATATTTRTPKPTTSRAPGKSSAPTTPAATSTTGHRSSGSKATTSTAPVTEPSPTSIAPVPVKPTLPLPTVTLPSVPNLPLPTVTLPVLSVP